MFKPRGVFSLSEMIEPSPQRAAHNANMIPTPDSASENVPPAKKSRARPKTATNKITKAKAPSRRTSGGSVAPARKGTTKQQKAAASKRAALQEQINEQRLQTSDTEELDDFEECEDSEMQNKGHVTSGDELDSSLIKPIKPKTKKAKAVRAARAQKEPGKRAKGAANGKHKVVHDQAPESAMEVEKASKPRSRAPKVVRAPSVTTAPHYAVFGGQNQSFIAETQPAPMDMDDLNMADGGESAEPTPRPPVRHSSRAPSVIRSHQPALSRRRDGTVDPEPIGGGSEPALRRKLGEVTLKYENLDLRYRTLREVGIKEAEANFEKLRRQLNEKSEAADKLISSLKDELASQTILAKESRSLQKQIATQKADLEKLQSQVSELTSSLSGAERENKALSAKLTAQRQISAPVQSSEPRVPGSAIKGHNAQYKTAIANAEAAAHAAKMAQLKEDLYSDLTGLILRSVKKADDAEIFDCIQTGRNGTLHFKLAVSTPDSDKTSYDDAEFVFTPLLDSNRDRDLIELLPDYLTEEITFARENAEKFYARVVDTLTKVRKPASGE